MVAPMFCGVVDSLFFLVLLHFNCVLAVVRVLMVSLGWPVIVAFPGHTQMHFALLSVRLHVVLLF